MRSLTEGTVDAALRRAKYPNNVEQKPNHQPLYQTQPGHAEAFGPGFGSCAAGSA